MYPTIPYRKSRKIKVRMIYQNDVNQIISKSDIEKTFCFGSDYQKLKSGKFKL